MQSFSQYVKSLLFSRGIQYHTTMVRTVNLSSDFQSTIDKACESLMKGHIIAVPTDTIYGIAGLAQNSDAARRIYDIKSRDLSKPIAISVADIEDLYKWGKIHVPRQLLCDLLPGPVTVVVERSDDLNPDLNPNTSLVGIRIPDHTFIRELARVCQGPIALTSANISGTLSPLNIKEFENIWHKLDLICDDGPLGNTASARQGSTVVDISIKGEYKIIREGSALKSTVDVLQTKYKLKERI
ncbi:hypothetical protein CHS0354_012893 [Potamilus streckersoni]|uniref:Threonylcarbamoyl-AMP synthase n=1 Tax=Potamilus streckersoni TaxID=2493646 RepID=A0AAE0SB76_9BIVA|nr:hypothetical protein CHS0354_012893 [Potamilus streckersoni]